MIPKRPLIAPLLLALLSGIATGCTSSAPSQRRPAVGAPANVLCGIDVLERDHFKLLTGQRVGLITNHSGRNAQGISTVDLLAGAQNFTLVCLFSPEHGLYSTIETKVGDTIDPKTHLKVYSLYGQTTRPTAGMLDGIDTLVFDIQDVGARFYTYSATLGICMEEAARHHIRFIVLDRPNPITGTIVQGPLADKSHFGFTAYGPMPVSHGMTFGELARLYKGAWGVNCDLTVIPIEGWRRAMWYDETGLIWTNPSPNMRNLSAAIFYPGLCLLEATNISVGRGTDQPFERFGAPWIDARALSAALNAARLPGIRFIPIEFTPDQSRFKGQLCQGVQLILTDRNTFQPLLTGVTLAWTLHHLFGDQFQLDKVEHLLQNARAMDAIRTAADPRQIPSVWQGDLEQFNALRKKYLLYE